MLLLPVSLFLVAAPFANAKAFLESGGAQSDMDMSDMMAVLLADEHPHAVDLSEAVRSQHAKDSHARNQAALQSMFKSLPKNEHGNLGLPAARYALHRLFEHRHRWLVRGLSPKSKAGKSGIQIPDKSHAVGKAMQTLMPFQKKGLTLPGLAALAGTLEVLIGQESTLHLQDLYKGLGHSVQGTVSGEALHHILDAYMTIYISGADFKDNSEKNIVRDDTFMKENTKDWTETKEWVRSATAETAKAEESCKGDVADCKFQFDDASRVLRKVVEKYGFFNDRECHKLKSTLLKVQEGRTGRLRLADFYNAGLSGAWEFNEKIDYLRSLGALDESKKDDPKVIVPNYVSSFVNCLSSSKFYSVCCRNECEDYMKVMEKHIAGDKADPDKIIRVVETQSVFTMDMPPNLSALRHRLISIAERHRGKVPIHGRLFAQWMHHAFPSTCPYPHEAGKTNPQTPDEWMTETGHSNVKASDDEMHKVVKRAQELLVSPKDTREEKPTVSETVDASAELPWSDVEELLVVRATPAPQAAYNPLDKWFFLMEGFLVVALVCVVIWMASELRQSRTSSNKGHKF